MQIKTLTVGIIIGILVAIISVQGFFLIQLRKAVIEHDATIGQIADYLNSQITASKAPATVTK